MSIGFKHTKEGTYMTENCFFQGLTLGNSTKAGEFLSLSKKTFFTIKFFVSTMNFSQTYVY